MNNHTINPETLRKRNSKKNETDEQRETRLKRDRERKRKKTAEETAEETDIRPRSAQTISEDEHGMLQDFRRKMDNIRYNSCPVCNERIPSMSLVKEMCRRCYMEKKLPKKFSAENNMNPGDVPD